MYIDWDEKTGLWCVFNNRDKAVASFASKFDAERYLEEC